MKKFFWIAGFVSMVLILAACGDVRRNPGRAYMPDMQYSRAYETYALLDSAKFTSDSNAIGEGKIYYNNLPVKGTMARGDAAPFPYELDKFGDSTNYVASKQYPNPLPPLNAGQLKEAERLFLVNCAICHGPNLDGNGPLWKGGDGPYSSAPKNLLSLTSMPDGQMFYSITYGKNAMGSYASQITTAQRWMIVHYIKSKQAAQASAGGTAKTDSTAAKTNAAKADTAAVKTK